MNSDLVAVKNPLKIPTFGSKVNTLMPNNLQLRRPKPSWFSTILVQCTTVAKLFVAEIRYRLQVLYQVGLYTVRQGNIR